MSDHEFLFTLRLPDEAGLDGMLRDLMASVFRHLGYAAAAIDELTDEVRAGIAGERAAGVAYDVRFRAHDGRIHVIVSRDGRASFRTSRLLP